MAEFVDLDVFGRENPDGTGLLHSGDDALSNALTAWLTTRRGDFVNRPDLGGPLDRLLFKNLGFADLDLLTFELKNQIRDNFEGVLQLLELSVIPDFENRLWRIEIAYRSSLTGNTNTLEVLTDASETLPQPSISLIDVDFEGENLLNFVLLKIPEQPEERLSFDPDTELWNWGIYKLTKFSTNSENFDQIFALINGAPIQ